jgi:nitroreductase
VEFAEVVRRRRMVRAYRPDPVDPAAVDRIVDLARRAPSAGFSQGQSFVVVTDPDQRRRVAESCREPSFVARGFTPWVSSAPLLVVPCVRPGAYGERYAEPDKDAAGRPGQWRVPYWWVDGGAALMLLLLAAVDEGLAAGFLDVADAGALRAVLGIPDDVEPLGVATIGYPARDRPSSSLRRGRRAREEVVHHDRWSSGRR